MPYLIEPVIPPGRLSGRDQPVLEAREGLIVRPWQPADASAVLEAYGDPEIQRWNLWRADSEEEPHEWIARWRQSWHDETGAHWAVVDGHRGHLRGRVALQRLILAGGQAEISYWTLPSARGAGVCSRSVAAVTVGIGGGRLPPHRTRPFRA